MTKPLAEECESDGNGFNRYIRFTVYSLLRHKIVYKITSLLVIKIEFINGERGIKIQITYVRVLNRENCGGLNVRSMGIKDSAIKKIFDLKVNRNIEEVEIE